jgi:hypothetical protein
MLRVARSCTERESIQDVANLLIRGLLARLGRHCGLGSARDVLRGGRRARQPDQSSDNSGPATRDPTHVPLSTRLLDYLDRL